MKASEVAYDVERLQIAAIIHGSEADPVWSTRFSRDSCAGVRVRCHVGVACCRRDTAALGVDGSGGR